MKLKLNLFPVVPDMEEKMAAILQEAVAGRASLVEIAYGTAAESVKKRSSPLPERNRMRRWPEWMK